MRIDRWSGLEFARGIFEDGRGSICTRLVEAIFCIKEAMTVILEFSSLKVSARSEEVSPNGWSGGWEVPGGEEGMLVFSSAMF